MLKTKVMILVFLLLGFIFLGACKEDRPNVNVVLITIDTLRADHLGCYGDEGIKTPNIDKLAEEGVLFEQCITVAPVTLPSHSSIMTGTYPLYHGVHDNGIFKLDQRFTTLAEVLKDNGYQTGGFVSAYPLTSRFQINQGFDFFDDETGAKHDLRFIPERKAEVTTAKALDWLGKRNKNIPFFLWMHYFDPHQLYDPPEPYKTEYKDYPYSGEIAYVDKNIGDVMEYLKQNNLYENTIIVITSDHGEGLGEHKETSHMFFVYDSTMRVPLIFRIPEQFAVGAKVSNLVRIIDIMPTILDPLPGSGLNIQHFLKFFSALFFSFNTLLSVCVLSSKRLHDCETAA